MDTQELIKSIFVGDVKAVDFYNWAFTRIMSGESCEYTDLLIGGESNNYATLDELIGYFKSALIHQNMSFPAVTRAEYLENIYKADFEKLILSVTEDELLYISNADHAQEVERHYPALKHLIFERKGIFSRELHWHPYECVELCRWGSNSAKLREFAICNCIIAQSIIVGEDISNDAQFMLDKLMPLYKQLPDDLRDLVIGMVSLAARCS
ncbi:MAG TPA: hypothetical protein PK129_17160 [Cellvibrionaceae bacterium]|nr:hypothetical protein [Cellvibrionaceae bacterium]